jgi:alkyl sulfatase BDS1-like metallo-beta-lactamase superfamily hydrolase
MRVFYEIVKSNLDEKHHPTPGRGGSITNRELEDILSCIIKRTNTTFKKHGFLNKEGAGWRNIYLTGAQELRLGKVSPGTPKTASADVLSEMDPGMLLDYIAVQVDSLKAQHTSFSMNIVVDGEAYFVEMSNGNLSNIKVDKPNKAADATITLDDEGFTKILLGQTRLSALVESKQASLKGDDTVLNKLVSTLVKFDSEFEIVPFSDKAVDANFYQ